MDTNDVTDERPGPSPAEQVFQHFMGFMISSALNVVVKLDIADRLADGPRTPAALAREADANEDALARVLGALAGVGLFAEDENGRFGLTPLSDLLRSESEPSLKPLVSWMSNPFHFSVFANLMHSVRTGQPAVERTYGLPLFEHFARDREQSDAFNAAMTSFSAVVVPAVLDAYDFAGIDVLVDVAGGHGQVLTSILQRYPDMRGVLFDLDHVIEGAKARIAELGLTQRCETATGDFFAQVPGGGDAYLMMHIIHDWDDERALAILRNTHAALKGRPNGRLLLLEAIVAPPNQPDLAKVIDIEMLALTGGHERSEAAFRALLRQAGFELTRVVPTKSPVSVIEAEAR